MQTSRGAMGGEFIIVLPQTDLSSTLDVAERIRKTIETAEMTDSQGSVFGITVSQGLASSWVAPIFSTTYNETVPAFSLVIPALSRLFS